MGKWAWEATAEDTRVGFADRSDAIADAAEYFQLSVKEVQELTRNGSMPIGLTAYLKVRPANDNE